MWDSKNCNTSTYFPGHGAVLVRGGVGGGAGVFAFGSGFFGLDV